MARKSLTVYDPPPAFTSPPPKMTKPKWMREMACLNAKQWDLLTAWCKENYRTLRTYKNFQVINIALCGIPKRSKAGDIIRGIDGGFEVEPAPIPRGKIDSNSITEAMQIAMRQLKKKPEDWRGNE